MQVLKVSKELPAVSSHNLGKQKQPNYDTTQVLVNFSFFSEHKARPMLAKYQ